MKSGSACLALPEQLDGHVGARVQAGSEILGGHSTVAVTVEFSKPGGDISGEFHLADLAVIVGIESGMAALAMSAAHALAEERRMCLAAGMPPPDLKLATGLFVLTMLALPNLRNK